MNQLDLAIREFEKAIALNPNFSDLDFPAVLNFAGEPLRALDLLQSQARLDAFHPSQVHAIPQQLLPEARSFDAESHQRPSLCSDQRQSREQQKQ